MGDFPSCDARVVVVEDFAGFDVPSVTALGVVERAVPLPLHGRLGKPRLCDVDQIGRALVLQA